MLARRSEIRMAILFGSFAHSRIGPQDDLDLAVLMDAPLSAKGKMALIGELATLTGRPIHVVDLRMAGEPLLGQNLEQEVHLCGSDTEYAKLIKRQPFEEADFIHYRRSILAERRRAWIG